MTTQLTVRAVGDPVPPTIAAYYEAADSGRLDEAATQLAGDVVAGLVPPGNEVNPLVVKRGREEMRAWLAQRDWQAVRHEVLFSAVDGATCFIEGRLLSAADGRPVRTYVSSFRLDVEGRIRRYVAYACEPFDELPRTDSTTPGDARRRVDDYFHHLDAAEFPAAVEQFSEDCTYNHPPYRGTGITSNRRVIFRGHAELLEGFNHRGPAAFDHVLTGFIQRGPNAMFELNVTGMPGAAPAAVCTLSLGDDGRIKRYLAYMTIQGVD